MLSNDFVMGANVAFVPQTERQVTETIANTIQIELAAIVDTTIMERRLTIQIRRD